MFLTSYVQLLDDAENGGPLSTTDDVSLYDAVDNAMKCKAARPRAFLDDSLEEEEEPSYASTCPMSCAIGGAVENPTVARVVETKAVDRLEYVESDVNAKPTCSAAKKGKLIFFFFGGGGEAFVSRGYFNIYTALTFEDCSVSSRQPNDCPTYSEPLASEPPPADVDRASSVGHKEELIPVQPCAKVMPTFGKKKVTLTVSTKAELPAKAKKPMSKGILKGAKGKHTMTADSKKSVEAKVADSAKNNYDETPCCSVASSQSLEDACPDPTTSRGGEVTALDECSSGEDAAGKTHRGAEKKASAGGGHIQKEEESGKAEQKQCSKQKRGKEKQVANKEKLPGAKKLEQERKKVERERKKAKKEEEKIEKELRMIEREFNRLEKENHAKKQDVTLCKSQCEEDEVNEKNEFHILNMEEESQALDCVQPYRADVLCVVDGHPLPTQERSPERAVPDEAAIPGEGAHLISIVTRGEEEEQEGPDPPDEAAVPAEESHVGPNEQVGTKKNMPSRASNAGGQKLSLNPAKKPAQKAAEGFGKQNEMMLKKASSQGRKETAGGPTPTPAWGGASGGPSTEGGGVSGGPSTEGGGVSGGPSTEWGGVSGGPSTEGGGVSDVQATEGGGAFSGQNIVVGGASKNPSTAGGGAGKDEKGGIVAKKLCAGVLKKGFGKSSAGTNKSTTPKCSTICATSAKLSKEKEHVGVKQKTFIAKTGEKKCNPSNASPARKKANTHSHHGPVWVQCDDCKKWRALNDCCDPSGVPEKWVCSMNKGIYYINCYMGSKRET